MRGFSDSLGNPKPQITKSQRARAGGLAEDPATATWGVEFRG